ncbi:hypothetical protein ACKWTF_006846 [Chironomus riparius]
MDKKGLFSLILLIFMTVKLHDCKLKTPRPSDTWTNQNFIFDKNLMFPVDYEETVSDDFRTIFSRDNILTPVQYLWQWLFNRQNLGKTPPPQQLPPIIIYATTEMPRTSSTTQIMTTTTVRDEFIPTGRTRRPLKYKIEGHCKNPPKSHENKKSNKL